MIQKIALALAASSLAMIPTAASAKDHHRHHRDRNYSYSYRSYYPSYGYYGYSYPSYGYSYSYPTYSYPSYYGYGRGVNVGYPGATYVLSHDAKTDQLVGKYNQPAMQQSFDVEFVRQPKS